MFLDPIAEVSQMSFIENLNILFEVKLWCEQYNPVELINITKINKKIKPKLVACRKYLRRTFLLPLLLFVDWCNESIGIYRQENCLSTRGVHEKSYNCITFHYWQPIISSTLSTNRTILLVHRVDGWQCEPKTFSILFMSIAWICRSRHFFKQVWLLANEHNIASDSNNGTETQRWTYSKGAAWRNEEHITLDGGSVRRRLRAQSAHPLLLRPRHRRSSHLVPHHLPLRSCDPQDAPRETGNQRGDGFG